MKTIRLTLLSIIFSLGAVPTAITYAAETSSAEPLKIGIFPRRNPTETFQLFKPMADYLSEQLNRKVKIITASNFSSFWGSVEQKEFDIVHYNQMQYIESHKYQSYEAILKNEEFGKTTIAGAIYVRKDSGINSLKDLEGRTINFGGGLKAMMAYVVPTALLRRAGLREGDYDELFSKNPPNTILSVYYKQADAAGTGDIIMKVSKIIENIEPSELKMIAESEQLPHVLWAVKGSMPAELKKQITNKMLELNNTAEGKAILGKAKLTGLHKTTDKEYDIHRKYVKEVFGEI